MKIEFSTDNATFCDPVTQEESDVHKATETAAILKRIAYAVEQGCISGIIVDSNGNVVGKWDTNN